MAILSFAPAYLVPLMATLFGIYAMTRILPPDEYGAYALISSLIALAQSALFSWLDLGTKRFFERASGDSKLPVLAMSIYLGLGFSTCILTLVCLVAMNIVVVPEELSGLIWIGAAVAVVKQASMISKVFELAALARIRYTLMECGESIVGLATGLALCWFLHFGAAGILCGMLVGAGTVVLFDARRTFGRMRGGRFDFHLQRKIASFAAPISLAFFVEYLIASSSRLQVEYFLGAHELGIYAVSYSIAERAVTAVFLALGVASYPLVVRAFERDGQQAARQQSLANAEVLVTVALPAWGGFIIASGHIARVLVGPAYSAQAAELMPLIGTAVFLHCIRAHYFAYSQHLSNRTWSLMVASVPAAIINVGLNMILLPRLGLMGAVWASLIAYGVALVISIRQSRAQMPLPFPTREALKATAATVAMCGTLHVMEFSLNLAGTVALILTGMAVYGTLVLAFDIGCLRSKALEVRGRIRATTVPAVRS